MVPIDLRSDTVTQPTPAMRQAMAGAEVGDDVYGEDPTVKKLERQVAALLGKERALFVPSGTMANQIALMLHTRRGDEVVIGEGTHCAEYESGAAAALSGVQLAVAGTGGLFDVPELDAKIRPSAYWLPRTSLLVVENTHNRGGGRVFPLDQLRAVTAHARARGLAVHLDGARLWNAAAASGVRLDEFAATADTVSICFSKGLGAPVGSALVGPSDLLEHALRLRRMLGGSMRQCGVLAAAALFAIDHHRARLTDDHEHAQLLARGLCNVRGARVDPRGVETNIVNIELDGPSAERVIARAKELGVLIGSIAPRFLRAVTHLDVSRDAATRAAAALAAAITDCHAT
ncbi:MAG: aminotransferase class I/II-fold pyridoxal phosphate-dependent enzyme [Myxococcales bacterium]|nr:aminotransferase class I/II-fold pyridoxal phosphate-dependent enzyme [Myxococcales bacterium]